jgi:hypothetical protein
MRSWQEVTVQIKTEFTHKHTGPVIIHWDGKLLPDFTENCKVDRLPVLVSGFGVQQLLAVPKLPRGTGNFTADAVYETVMEWGLQEKVCGMAFDTTSVNTGFKNGACTILERKVGRRLLSFACRHHMYEIVLQKIFSLALGETCGPDMEIFNRFKLQWKFIDHGFFRTAAADRNMKINDIIREEVLHNCQLKIHDAQPREDYLELLNLTIIFLGSEPPNGIHFKAPGGLHNARWMARLLYSFKVYMFGTTSKRKGHKAFKLTSKEEDGLRDLFIFPCWWLHPGLDFCFHGCIGTNE